MKRPSRNGFRQSGNAYTMREKFRSLKVVGPMLVLFMAEHKGPGHGPGVEYRDQGIRGDA